MLEAPYFGLVTHLVENQVTSHEAVNLLFVDSAKPNHFTKSLHTNRFEE